MMLLEHRWSYALTAILALGANGCGCVSVEVAPPGPVCAGACEEVTAAEGLPTMIAVGAKHVYWTTFSSDEHRGVVLRAPLAGGDAQEIASFDAEAAPRIALDAGHVYWSEIRTATGSVRRALLDGKSPETLADAVDLPAAIVVDSTSVYFNRHEMSPIAKVPLAGGPITPLGDNPLFVPHAVDATYLYGTASFAGEGAVSRIPIGGGDTEVIASVHGDVRGFALGAESIYVTSHHEPFLEWDKDPVSTVWQVPLGGGEPISITTLGSPQGIAVDESGVYFTDSFRGTVQRAALDGSSIEVIASGLSGPTWIALDAGHVYWSDSKAGHGTIMRMAK